MSGFFDGSFFDASFFDVGTVTPEPVYNWGGAYARERELEELPSIFDDDDMLMVWFTYLARYYAKN